MRERLSVPRHPLRCRAVKRGNEIGVQEISFQVAQAERGWFPDARGLEHRIGEQRIGMTWFGREPTQQHGVERGYVQAAARHDC
ncbi:MAG: hypothetical protein M0038_22195 [Pseudomonadota bacterium]|nr:hypothetical protein [Pseudomonadota bacterium]